MKSSEESDSGGYIEVCLQSAALWREINVDCNIINTINAATVLLCSSPGVHHFIVFQISLDLDQSELAETKT